MVHLRCFHTRAEDVELSYSVSRLKDVNEDIDHDVVALDKLRTSVRMRLAALEKIEFFQVVVIKQSHDYSYNNRIVFYVSRNLYAKDNGQEIYVEGHDHKSFLWKERKQAFAYAWDLGTQHKLQIRDLTKKMSKETGIPPDEILAVAKKKGSVKAGGGRQ